MKISYTARANGTGHLTASDMNIISGQFPGDARIKLGSGEDYHESTWTVEATWEVDTDVKPTSVVGHIHKPGCRDGDAALLPPRPRSSTL